MKTNIFIAVLLGGLALTAVLWQFRTTPGMDFYQYWAVGQAQKWSELPLKSSYVEGAQYSAVLNRYVEHSSDLRLKKANQWRQSLELFQTPLCFWLFAAMLANYSIAISLFQILQSVAFIAVLLILGRTYHETLTGLLALVFLLLMATSPCYRI